MEGLLRWDGHEYDACCAGSYDYYAHIRVCDEANFYRQVGRIEKVRSTLGCLVMRTSKTKYSSAKAVENICIDFISWGGSFSHQRQDMGGEGKVIFHSCLVRLAGRRFNHPVE